jgi:hypothetical protein
MKFIPAHEAFALDYSCESSLLAMARQKQFNERSVFDVLTVAGITSLTVETDLSKDAFIVSTSPMAGERSAAFPCAIVQVLVVRCLPPHSCTGWVTLPQALEGMLRNFLDLTPGELPHHLATFELDVAQRRLTVGCRTRLDSFSASKVVHHHQGRVPYRPSFAELQLCMPVAHH